MRRSVFLAAAFGALLLVIGGTSIAVWSNARIAQNRINALHRAHMEAGTALATVRANVYLAAVFRRDYLLDPDPAHALEYFQQFTIIKSTTDRALSMLDRSAQDDDQKAAVNQLRQELSTYWDPTDLMQDWAPNEKRSQRAAMLRQRDKRRHEIFTLAARVEEMTTDNFERERERITKADRDFRVSLGWTTGIALMLGGAIAVASLMRMLKLERQSHAAESELRLLSGQLRTAQEQERKHLSRELHDQVGQMLTGLRMELAGIARLLADSESEISSRIARAKGTVEQTLRIVRNIAMLLRPSMLDDLGLSPALAWLVKDMSRSSGIDIQSSIDSTVDALPEAQRTCIYRLVQEALTNAVRHSGARRVEVVIQARAGSVVGTVSDDGKGFDPDRRRGLGLLGMEERVRELGGTIRVVSQPGHGTRVELRLPRPAAPEVESDTSPDRGRSRDRSGGVETTA